MSTGRTALGLTMATVLGIWISSIDRTAPQSPPPDTIYVNAKVVTVDQSFSYAQAVAVTGDKFTAVGTSDAIRKLAGPNTKVVNLGGRTVVPGLTDNHLHSAGGGPGVDLSRTRTLDDVLNAIAARVKQSQPGDIITTNMDWDELQLKERRVPLRRDLDQVAPAHPVVVVRGRTKFILNSVALDKWRITRETAVPPGGHITRYPDGELNGELVDTAMRLVTLPPAPEESLEERIQQQVGQYNTLHAAGLTSVRHAGGPIEQYRMLKEMQHRGMLTMRVTQLLSIEGGDPAEARSTVQSWRLRPDDGDGQLRIGGIKLRVDGGYEGGWMREPYEEPLGEGGTYRGLNIVPQERFNAIVKELNRLDWRVWTHAVGDAAIDEVLAGYEGAHAEKSIAGKRWGIEHGFIPQPDHFARIKALGLGVSGQNHLYRAASRMVKNWGRKRADWTTPMKAYLDAGVPVSGGTDAPAGQYPPLWVIYHFVTRDTINSGVHGADQKISREDALRLVTRNHAWLTFEESTKGSIEVGKYADLVVLEDDLMTCPEQRIEQMQVLMTMVGGKIVHQHADFKRLPSHP